MDWLDVYEPSAPVPAAAVLLLHGSGPNERDVIAPLANELTGLGAVILAPDWDVHSDDLAGRLGAAAEQAVRFAATRQIRRLVVAGWSAGGSAALWLSCSQPATFSRLALIATSLQPIPALRPAAAHIVETVFVTGSADHIVPAADSQTAIAELRASGYRVSHVVVDADHAGVIQTEFDETRQRCRPSSDPAVLEAGGITARSILGL